MSTVATYAYVNPVIAVLLGVLVVGERFSALQLLGGGIVLVAVVLVIAAERPRRPRPVPAAAGTGGNVNTFVGVSVGDPHRAPDRGWGMAVGVQRAQQGERPTAERFAGGLVEGGGHGGTPRGHGS